MQLLYFRKLFIGLVVEALLKEFHSSTECDLEFQV